MLLQALRKARRPSSVQEVRENRYARAVSTERRQLLCRKRRANAGRTNQLTL